jgi:WG containing repeat
MRCLCGQENPQDSRFCVACGGSLSQDNPAAQPVTRQAVAPAPQAASVAAARVAPSYASQAVAAQPAVERTETPSAAARTGIAGWKLLVLVVLVAAGVGVYFWLNRPQPAYRPKASGLYPVAVNGKWGYIDRTGALVIPATYDVADDFSEGLAAVMSQDKFGYIDTHGVLKIPFQFDQVHQFTNGLAAVKLCCGHEPSPNDQWGYIDKNGKYVINPQFTAAFPFFSELAAVQQAGGFWGFIDRKGKFIIPAAYARALPLIEEGLAPVEQNGRFGYVNLQGKFVINPQFEVALGFSDGLAPAKIGGKVGFIDRSGQWVINPQFDDRNTAFEDGVARVSSSGKPALIDKKGRFIVNPGQFTEMTGVVDGQVGVTTPNGAGLMDKAGNWVLAPNPVLQSVLPLGLGIARARIADQDCFMDQTGNIIYGRFKGQSLSAIAAGVASEKQAIATLKTLNTAQLGYASTYTTVGFADKLSALGPPPAGAPASQEHAGLIDAELASGNKGGYRFSLKAEPQDGILSQYSITATPTTFSAGNVYCTDATGAVRFSKSGEACTTNSPIVQ